MKRHSYVIAVIVSMLIYSTLSLFLYTKVPSVQSHYDLDSPGYDTLAYQLATTGSFGLTDHPIQMLGYPVFLAGIYRIAGYTVAALVMVQVLLGALLCGLISVLACCIGGYSAGTVAALMASMNLGFLVFAQFILTEILLAVCITSALMIYSWYLQTRRCFSLAAAAGVAGFSLLIKPALLYFLPCMLIFIVPEQRSWRAKIVRMALCSALFIAPLIGYTLRNTFCYGQRQYAPILYENIFRYFSAKVKARLEGTDPREALYQLPPLGQGSMLADDAWAARKALFMSYVRHHPLVVAQLWAENMLKTVLGLYATQLKLLLEPALKGGECSYSNMPGPSVIVRACRYICYGTQSRVLHAIAYVEVVWSAVRYVLALLGLWYLIRRRLYAAALFMVVLCAYCVSITGHDGCARYRLMIEPCLIVLAALGSVGMSVRVCHDVPKQKDGNEAIRHA